MKTKEELNALKEEVETVSKKLHELTDEELAHVFGGAVPGFPKPGIEQLGIEFSSPNYLNLIE